MNIFISKISNEKHKIYQNKSLMKQSKSIFARQKCIKLICQGKVLCQILKITLILFFISFSKCQTAYTYTKTFNSPVSQPRVQAVSNDGLYFVTSYLKEGFDSLKVFKTEQIGFSQVADIQLNKTIIRDMKIINRGQKIVYIDSKSYKVKIHQKRFNGSFQSQPDQQIYVETEPKSFDISTDGNLMVVAGSDTFLKIYKSNKKFSKYVLLQSIDVVSEVSGEAITNQSNFYTCSFSKDLKTLVFSGQTGEIYVYQFIGTTFKFFQKILSPNEYYNTYALKLNSDSTIMIAENDRNLLSFYREGYGKEFRSYTVYNDCLFLSQSRYAVSVTDNGDTFYASCQNFTAIYVFKRQKNSKSDFTLSHSINTMIDVQSISVSGQGAYLVVGGQKAKSFNIFQYLCQSGSYLNLVGNCQTCKNIKCNKCSRLSPIKCLSCKQGLMIRNSCQKCWFFNLSCLACDTSSCICDSSKGNTYQLECQTCTDYICKKCFLGCKTCSGSAFSQCLSCKENYVLQANNSCVLNCFSTCKTCSGPAFFQCLSCKENYVLQANNSCLQFSKSTMIQEGSFSSTVITIIIVILFITITTITILCLIGRYISNKEAQRQQSGGQYQINPDLVGSAMNLQRQPEKFNKKKFKQRQFQTCSICLEKDVTHQTLCNHYFHLDCINNWIARQKNCPDCRRPVIQKDIRDIK